MSQFTNAWHALYTNTTDNFNRKYSISKRTRKNRKNRKTRKSTRRLTRK